MMPSEVDPGVHWFDRFACAASQAVSRAWFFAACVLLIVVWAPSYLLIGDLDTWQLIINTATTIVTFLLVALLQNSQERADQATQHKLNAVAVGLMEVLYQQRLGCAARGEVSLAEQILLVERELRAAVGLEERESS